MSEEKFYQKPVEAEKAQAKPSVPAAKVVAPAIPKLTDEEVWLRGYCAAISAGGNIAFSAKSWADKTLAEFKEANK